MLAAQLLATPLNSLHLRLQARMAAFAGWRLPLQFAGMVSEHEQVRSGAGLFDVSHMCQFALVGADRVVIAERLFPIDVAALAAGRNRYTFMCNEEGGVIDDLLLGNDGDRLFVVCNASRAESVLAHIADQLQGDCTIERFSGRALLALQGPEAAAILRPLISDVDDLFFMDSARLRLDTVPVRICRCGYTGEDGFEISVAADDAAGVAERLLAEGRATPAGLGARDLLRIEAGLCLYGNELDESINPIEAGLAWSISPRRRREGGFIGDQAVLDMLAKGARRKLVGLKVDGRLPLRAGALLRAEDDSPAGKVTSGCWSPALGQPIALALVDRNFAAAGTSLTGSLRGRTVACKVAALPHLAPRYRIRSGRQAGRRSGRKDA